LNDSLLGHRLEIRGVIRDGRVNDALQFEIVERHQNSSSKQLDKAALVIRDATERDIALTFHKRSTIPLSLQ